MEGSCWEWRGLREGSSQEGGEGKPGEAGLEWRHREIGDGASPLHPSKGVYFLDSKIQ